MPPRFTGPTYPCPRCGSVAEIKRLSVPDLRRLGYAPLQPGAYVNWCGHAQEFVPLPKADGLCDLVPILGEAS